MTKQEVQNIGKLSEISNQAGSYNFILGLIAFIVVTLLGGLGYIIKQNSEAITSIPRELSALNANILIVDRKLDRLIEVERKIDSNNNDVNAIGKKIDLIFVDKFIKQDDVERIKNTIK